MQPGEPKRLDRPEERADLKDKAPLKLELDGRGLLNLRQDTAQHRRFTWLYDDLLS